MDAAALLTPRSQAVRSRTPYHVESEAPGLDKTVPDEVWLHRRGKAPAHLQHPAPTERPYYTESEPPTLSNRSTPACEPLVPGSRPYHLHRRGTPTQPGSLGAPFATDAATVSERLAAIVVGDGEPAEVGEAGLPAPLRATLLRLKVCLAERGQGVAAGVAAVGARASGKGSLLCNAPRHPTAPAPPQEELARP